MCIVHHAGSLNCIEFFFSKHVTKNIFIHADAFTQIDLQMRNSTTQVIHPKQSDSIAFHVGWFMICLGTNSFDSTVTLLRSP